MSSESWIYNSATNLRDAILFPLDEANSQELMRNFERESMNLLHAHGQAVRGDGEFSDFDHHIKFALGYNDRLQPIVKSYESSSYDLSMDTERFYTLASNVENVIQEMEETYPNIYSDLT